jgi:hypothetical protein
MVELIENKIYFESWYYNNHTKIGKAIYLNTNNRGFEKCLYPHLNEFELKHSPEGNISFELRLATFEEKHWLNECIKADKFIPFNELQFNKTYKLW